MKSNRIPLLLPLLLPALAPPLPAAVPERWTAAASGSVAPHVVDAYHGETVSLECALVDGGRALDLAGAAATLHWQTNGMGALWWEAPAAVTNGAVRATWTPEMDCGADAYRFFLRVSSGGAGVSYRANGTLRMLGSPGETPSTLPLPRQSLDFAAIEVLNAPWATSLSDLSGDSDHMLVSASEKEAWNDKADASDIPHLNSPNSFLPYGVYAADAQVTGAVLEDLESSKQSKINAMGILKCDGYNIDAAEPNVDYVEPGRMSLLLSSKADTTAVPMIVADTIAESDTWLTISNGTCRIYTSATNDLGETVASNVWSSAEASEGMPDAAATNALWQAIRTLNKSWGDYAPDGSENPDPDYQVLVNTPALSLASGFRWATAGTYAVLATSGAVAFAAGNSGQLRIGSDVISNYFGYVEGGQVTVGCSAAAIAMGQDDTVGITYPYEGGDFPAVWFSASLAEPDWEEVSPVWVDNGDGTATATCAATTDAGFYKATTSATSSPQFISTMPINAAGGVIGGDPLHPVVYNTTITIQSGGHTYRIPAELVE